VGLVTSLLQIRFRRHHSHNDLRLVQQATLPSVDRMAGKPLQLEEEEEEEEEEEGGASVVAVQLGEAEDANSVVSLVTMPATVATERKLLS
jgi:hypothetical protein